MSDTKHAPSGGPFRLASNYQLAAIAQLPEELEDGLARQTLSGVTGSGKTFTMTNVIARAQRPALTLAPNKTLAAQLYGEMREFFPHNTAGYFASCYDYQPEACVPTAPDTFIGKDASINEHIEQMCPSATNAQAEYGSLPHEDKKDTTGLLSWWEKPLHKAAR